MSSLSFVERLLFPVLGVLLIVLTFPPNEWVIAPGVDGPLPWVFNEFFLQGYVQGRELAFPHGPLAFFMYPLADTSYIVAIVIALLKLLLFWNLLSLLKANKEDSPGPARRLVYRFLWPWAVAASLAYLWSVVAGFNLLLLANVFLLYANYYLHRQISSKWLAFALTAFACYVKAYVAILTALLFVAFQVYFMVQSRNWKRFVTEGVGMWLLLLGGWLFIFGTIRGWWHYCRGMIELAMDNSAAAAYFPENNWWALSAFIGLLAVLFIRFRHGRNSFYWALALPLMFGAWKHGMAREDIYHVYGFWLVIVMLMSIFLLWQARRTWMSCLLTVSIPIFLAINLPNSVNYHRPELEWLRGSAFMAQVRAYEDLREAAEETSKANISEQVLPSALRQRIGDHTVDVYPWDYSIAAANALHWRARPVLHSYASYTSWLDQQNADHFASAQAPSFIIWEWDQTKEDRNGNSLRSIDARYLLNDEPQTLLSLLRHYRFAAYEEKYLLLEKRAQPLAQQVQRWDAEGGTFNTWLSVPHLPEGLLRARIRFKKPFLLSLKSFIYKDEQYWLHLKLNDGRVDSYRIVPKNATDGIWINPYLTNTKLGEWVDSIRLECSSLLLDQAPVQLSWDAIDFPMQPDAVPDFWGIGAMATTTRIHYSRSVYTSNYTDWKPDLEQLDLRVSGTEAPVESVKPSGYSRTFQWDLDSLALGEYKITLRASVARQAMPATAVLVMEVQDSTQTRLWEGQAIGKPTGGSSAWQDVSVSYVYRHESPGSMLKAYLWNNSEEILLLEELEVSVSSLIRTRTN